MNNDSERDAKARAAAEAKRAEAKLRGKTIGGAEQRDAVDHVAHEKTRRPDAELHLDGEEDDLYADGIDLDDDAGPPAGTDGNR